MRPIILALALALVNASSMAMAATVAHEASIDVAFPDSVAGLPFIGRKAFPTKALGVNIAYQLSGEPTRGSIYIYDAGISDIPDGTENEVVRRHFDQVIGEVRQLKTLGKLDSVTFTTAGPQTTAYKGCGPQFIRQEYDMAMPEGVVTSYTYLTGLKNNFVKLRVSHPKGDQQARSTTDQFVQQIRKVLGHCR